MCSKGGTRSRLRAPHAGLVLEPEHKAGLSGGGLLEAGLRLGIKAVGA